MFFQDSHGDHFVNANSHRRMGGNGVGCRYCGMGLQEMQVEEKRHCAEGSICLDTRIVDKFLNDYQKRSLWVRSSEIELDFGGYQDVNRFAVYGS